MNEKGLYEDIKRYCEANANPELVQKYSRYFKEGYDAYGLARQLLEDKVSSILSDTSVDMNLILKTSRFLVGNGKYEETFFAVLMLKEFSEQFSGETFIEIGKWFEVGIVNWAHTDVVCRDIVTPFIERNIVTLESFSDWRTAENKYQRRAVPVLMLTLLESTSDFFPLYAFIEPLMMNPDRVVQQGLGWFLREAWKIKRDDTESFLLVWKNNSLAINKV